MDISKKLETNDDSELEFQPLKTNNNLNKTKNDIILIDNESDNESDSESDSDSFVNEIDFNKKKQLKTLNDNVDESDNESDTDFDSDNDLDIE
jgi:hypothetical protein